MLRVSEGSCNSELTVHILIGVAVKDGDCSAEWLVVSHGVRTETEAEDIVSPGLV